MALECFDLIIEGTTINDIFEFDASKTIAVVDKSRNYGTTYSKINDLFDSPFITDLNIKSKDEKTQSLDITFIVETMPFLLSPSDNCVKRYSEKVMGDYIEYININDIFFISETQITRIPTSKNDLLKIPISNTDRFYLMKALRDGDVSEFSEKFSDKNSMIYKALAELKIFEKNDLKKISLGFGDTIFVYPKYGLSELCEAACFRNAFKGVTYILNKTLEYSKSDEDEYKHLFTCDLGVIKAKDYKRQKLFPGKSFVRVVVTSKIKFNGNFLAYIDLFKNEFTLDMEGNDDEIGIDKYVKVIGLDSLTNVCNERLQIFYFIKKHSKVKDLDIKPLLLSENDILIDLSFTTKYDINQFN